YVQADDGIRHRNVTGVQTCALPISQEITAPVGSVIDTMVLLKVLLMNACPLTMFFLSLRRGLRAAGWRVLVAMRRNSSGGIWCAGSLSGARVGAGLRRGQDQRGGDGAPGSA